MNRIADDNVFLHKFRRHFFITIGALFVSCFIILFLIVEPWLIYYSFGDFIDFPEFSFDYSFLKESLSMPGGVVSYSNGFLSQCFYYPLAAALIITVIAFGYWLVTYLLIETTSGVRSMVLSFLPALWVLMLFGSYNYQLTRT